MNQTGKSHRNFAIRTFTFEVLRNFGLCEPFERQFIAQTMQQQVLLECLQRAFGHDQVGGTKSSQQEQFCRFAPARNSRN